MLFPGVLLIQTPSRFIGSAVSEVRWLWHLAGAKRAGSAAGVPSEMLRIAKENVRHLRTLLRKQPDWQRGHLLLATFELECFRLAADRNAIRDLAAAKLSAEAALALQNNLDPAVITRHQTIAQLVLAQVAHYERKYDVSLDLFAQLTSEKRQVLLSDREAALCMEFSGAGALALEDYPKALQFFSAIPEQLRSGETAHAIAFLSAREGADFGSATASPPPTPKR